MATELKTKRIFALDYGRGTMAGFYCDPLHVELFQPIMNDTGEPSGFALMQDGRYILGNGLYVMDGIDFKKCKQMVLNVKALPDGDDALQIEYAKAWREKIKSDHPDLFRDCEEVWLIGCPTAEEWRHKTVVNNYKRIFEEAGYQNVIIVPESNAALMCLRLRYDLLDKTNNEVGVLCIDLGAYSSDSTYVIPGKVQSFGGYVGASLIERMILAKNLEGALCKKQKNSDELIAVVANKFREDPKFANYLLLHAKKLKEMYFSRKVDGANYIERDCVDAVDICLGDEKIDALGFEAFVLAVNDDMIRVITEEESVKSVLGEEFDSLSNDVKNDLGEMTWSESLKEFLIKTKEKFPVFANAACTNNQKACLVLTGGASLMPFVEDIVKMVFPYVEIYNDTAPMSTIAKGLLYFGPDKVKSMELLGHLGMISSHDANGNEVEAQHSVLNIIASEAHDKLGLEMISNTLNKMVNSLVEQTNRWQGKEIDSENIVPNARSNFEYWFKNNMHEEYLKSIAATKNFLAEELNKIYIPLLEHLKIDGNLLKSEDICLDYAENLFEWWSSLFEIFDKQMEEEHEIYKQLPNPGMLGSIFGTSRAQYLAQIAEKLDTRNQNWFQQVFKDALEIFNSPDIYGPFKIECLSEIVKVINERTKVINNALLLEESFDDED